MEEVLDNFKLSLCCYGKHGKAAEAVKRNSDSWQTLSTNHTLSQLFNSQTNESLKESNLVLLLNHKCEAILHVVRKQAT